MIFNPDLTKQAQEVIFSRKTKKLVHPRLSFNDIPLKNSISRKHLGFTLDAKLNLVERIKNITREINKTKGLLRRFQPVLPRLSLLTIYKILIRSQLDFADAIYDQAYDFVKSVQIRSFSLSVFSQNTEKYGPEKMSYLDTFHEVIDSFSHEKLEPI